MQNEECGKKRLPGNDVFPNVLSLSQTGSNPVKVVLKAGKTKGRQNEVAAETRVMRRVRATFGSWRMPPYKSLWFFKGRPALSSSSIFKKY
jgi:hypothetical protein